MCCNNSNNNGNVQGNSGRRRCCCWDKGNVRGATEIALRGPGCISGTGRCGRFTENLVQGESGFDDDYYRVSPDRGNNNNWRRDCYCTLRCLEQLLSAGPVCPR